MASESPVVDTNQDSSDRSRPTCFIAMPISIDPESALLYGDSRHWEHVMDFLFVPAITAAGYAPIRPISRGSNVIHDWIFEQLSTCTMVLGDFSSHNANVFYELGIRTALNLPMALVLDEKTTRPFDLGTLNSHPYQSTLDHWGMEEQIALLAEHIRTSAKTCNGANPLWYRFSLGRRAHEDLADLTPTEARLRLLEDEVRSLDLRLSYSPTDAGGDPPTRTYRMRGTLRVDLSAYRTSPVFLDVSHKTTVQELLDNVFNELSDHVRPYRYMEDWSLVTESGRPLTSKGRGDVRPLLATWGLDPMGTVIVRPGDERTPVA